MDFSLTEEQQLLKDSVDRFVRENYEFESRRKFADSNDGYGEGNWKQMAELGWLSVALPDELVVSGSTRLRLAGNKAIRAGSVVLNLSTKALSLRKLGGGRPSISMK